MKIALFAPQPPEPTGIADYAWRFRQALEAAGVIVVSCIPPGYQPNSRAALRAWIKGLSLADADLAHFELGGGLVREFLILEDLRQCHPFLPVTATVHDPERLVWRTGELRFFQRLPNIVRKGFTLLSDPLTLYREQAVATHIDCMVTLTAIGAECLAQRLKVTTNRVRVIPHGTEQRSPAALPPFDIIYLICFGYLYAGKGHEDIITALNQIKLRTPELLPRLRVTLAGGSQAQTAFGTRPDYLQTLQGMINSAGLSNRLTIRADVPELELASLIQSHHAMILPYRESSTFALLGRLKGASGALSWAIGCGRGALVSDARALPEEVSFGNGAVFRQGDSQQLAAWLQRLTQDPKLLVQWAEHASQLAGQRSWHMVAQGFITIFETVLSNHRSDPHGVLAVKQKQLE